MLLQAAFTLCRTLHKPIRPQNLFSQRTFHQPFQHEYGPPKQSQMQYLRSYSKTSQTRLSKLEPAPFDTNLSQGCGQVPPKRSLIPPNNLIKAILFTGAFTIGCFMGATILEYENTRNTMLDKAKKAKFPWFQQRQPQVQHQVIEKNPLVSLKNEVRRYWNQLTPGEKVFAPICAINLIVFGMWRVPSMRKTMMTYFCSNPAARVICWPMFLSTFSHYSTFHIFANMYVLHSFANGAVSALGKEQFLAVYLSGGVISSLASIIYKTVTSQAGLSIGASGAIMTILAYVCTQFPDTQLNILFLPMFAFSAGAAIKVIMGIDLVGCLLGWKFFDHAAHLGGALFGVFWVYYGNELWQKRIRFMNKYHELRKTK